MTAMTDFLEEALLDHVLKISAYTVPTNLYVALWTTTPADDGTGGVEVTGGSYARQLCNGWGAGAADNERSNTAALTFPNMPAVTVVGASIQDHITNLANMLFVGALTAPVAMTLGNDFVFAIGAIDVQMN